MSDEQYFDSHVVSKFIGKFPTVQFDIDEDVAGEFKFDDVVSFLVTTRVENASFAATKTGELRRLNVFKVHRVQPVSPEFAEKFMSIEPPAPTPVSMPVALPVETYARVVIQPTEVLLTSQDIVMADEDEYDEVWIHPSQDSNKTPIKSVGKDDTLRKFLEG
jgi:hypothetical protein